MRYIERKDAPDRKKFRVKMHGLPFRASEYEIAKWFEPDSLCSDVEIHMNREGRPSGDATAFFDSDEQAENVRLLETLIDPPLLPTHYSTTCRRCKRTAKRWAGATST